MEDRTSWYRSLGITVWAIVGVLVLAGITLYVLSHIRAVLMPLLYAIVLVYLFRPPINALENRGVPRIAALLIVYLVGAAALIMFGAFLAPIIATEIRTFAKNTPEYLRYLETFFENIGTQFTLIEESRMEAFLGQFAERAKESAMQLTAALPGITATLFGGMVNLILAPIIAFYILKDLRAIKATIVEAVPERHRDDGLKLLHTVDFVVGGFLKGQLLIAFLVGLMSGVALAVLGIDYAILLGVIIGVLNIVPYLGPVVGAVPAVLIALGQSWQLAVIVVVALTAIQQVESAFLAPNIMQRKVNLHPVVIILALIAGASLFGIVGMLVAVPIAAVCKAVYLYFKQTEAIESLQADDVEIEKGEVLNEVK